MSNITKAAKHFKEKMGINLLTYNKGNSYSLADKILTRVNGTLCQEYGKEREGDFRTDEGDDITVTLGDYYHQIGELIASDGGDKLGFILNTSTFLKTATFTMTNKDIIEYVDSLPKTSVEEIFKPVFKEGAYVYAGREMSRIPFAKKIFILENKDLFTFSDGSAIYASVTPIEKPERTEDNGNDKALKEVSATIFNGNLPVALEIAYGGSFKNISASKTHQLITNADKTSYSYGNELDTKNEEERIQAIDELVAYLEDVKNNNERLVKLIDEAGGGLKFKKKAIEEMSFNIRMQAPVLANHEDPNVNSAALIALQGVK